MCGSALVRLMLRLSGATFAEPFVELRFKAKVALLKAAFLTRLRQDARGADD
jgi:hypothetical protein